MKKTKLYTHYRKLLADTITPVSIYLNVRDQYPNALLLESSDYHSKEDSYSFICLNPIADFEGKDNLVSIKAISQHTITKQLNDKSKMLDELEAFISSFEIIDDTLPFSSQGLYGYSSFEAVQYFEDINLSNEILPNKDIPDLKYQLFEIVIAIDHFKNELYIVKTSTNHVSTDDTSFDHISSLIRQSRTSQFKFIKTGNEIANIEAQKFKHIVSKGIDHCKRGDVFQVVLAREFKQSFKGDDFNVYRSIRNINPSPYLFYFDYGSFKIFGSSPESQIIVHENEAYIDPIAGTVKRTGDVVKDKERAEEMTQNPKEMGEHMMLVDLARNDLSKHSHHVEVQECAEIQYFSHVIHMVSKVKGEIEKGASALKIYADTFPAGTLSGAPKYRALQIINEYEPNSRSFYGGAIGFLGFNGSINHAIIIRSVLSKDMTLTYQAGAGVVAASTPEGELEEVNNKVAAIRQAIVNAEAI